MSTKPQCYYLVPTKVKEMLAEAGYNKTELQLAKKTLCRMFKWSKQADFNSFKWHEIPEKYMKQMMGRNASAIMRRLVNAGIVEVYKSKSGTESYSVKNKTCKKYRVYPELQYTDKWDGDSYTDNQRKVVNDDKILLHPISTDVAQFEKAIVLDDLKQLRYNTCEMLEVTKDVIEKVSYDCFKTDDQVEDEWMVVYNNLTDRDENNGKQISKQWALDRAKKAGATLIGHKNGYFIDDLDRFIETRKKNIMHSYQLTINSVEKGIFYANRNETNTRLDHNLSSICKHNLEIIKNDNGLTEIDLNNSQFTILAYWLKKNNQQPISTDVAQFCELVQGGVFYEYMSTIFGCDRSEAKRKMLKLTFGPNRPLTGDYKKFAEAFPGVYEFMKAFKADNGYKAFSVELQKMEADIMVDNVYYLLKQEGLFAVPRHDSMLVKNEDVAKALGIMNGYFQTINFKCNLKVK